MKKNLFSQYTVIKHFRQIYENRGPIEHLTLLLICWTQFLKNVYVITHCSIICWYAPPFLKLHLHFKLEKLLPFTVIADAMVQDLIPKNYKFYNSLRTSNNNWKDFKHLFIFIISVERMFCILKSWSVSRNWKANRKFVNKCSWEMFSQTSVQFKVLRSNSCI